MTQTSFIQAESRGKGAKRTIKLAAIAAGDLVQYRKDHSKLAGVIRSYGYFNQITVINGGAVGVEIALDFSEAKTYPIVSNSSFSLDETMYEGFNVVNLDAANPTVINEITVIAAYEAPLLREKMKSKKMMLRGGR